MSEDLSIVCAPPAEFQDTAPEEYQINSPNSALKQTPGTSQDFPKLSQPNALYSNEKVDLIRPNEQPLPSESTDTTNLASLLTRSIARSSYRNSSNALWRGYCPLQNSSNNVQSSSATTPDNNERSTDNEEDTMQRSSFRRSSKPIRRKSIIQRGPRPGIHLEGEPQGACGYTPPTDIKTASSEDTEETMDLYLSDRLIGQPSAYGAGDCRPKVPIAAQHRNKTTPVTNELMGTNNLSFQPDTLADHNTQHGRPVSLKQQGNHTDCLAVNETSGNADCRPKISRCDPPDGTNQVTSEGMGFHTAQQGPIYQNFGPALRGAQNQAAVSRRRESSDEDSVLLELIMTGDEHCVEDWPLGSPELDPNFRPSGSLRLRRESFRLKELEEINLELTKKPSTRRTLRRFKSKTKATPQQNQDPQGAGSSDASAAPTTVGATNLPEAQSSSGDMEMTRNPLRSSFSSITSEMSNPWDNYGASSGDITPVSDDTNHPRHGPTPPRPAPVDHTAAVNPLPTIYEANNMPLLNPQTGALPRNNMSAAPRSQDVYLGGDVAAVDDATVTAMANWLTAQMDEINRAREAEEEEEDGDTDSLMEWWYTVEEWNQVPLETENMFSREEERRSFSILIDKVHRALIVFYRVFTECAETLWQSVIILHAIADDIKKFHKGAVIASITGGVAMGLGGVAVLVGLVLAPITLGFSLIATVAGLGMATAGGVTTGTALMSDSVNDKRDRKKAASILVDNENYLLEIQKILTFIRTGLSRFRDHPMLLFRRGIAQDDRDIQKAVQMQRLLIAPVSQALAVTTRAVNAVQGMFSGVNRYFVPGHRKLKKSYITVIVMEIKESASVLQSCVSELNNIKNQLEVATERCGLVF